MNTDFTKSYEQAMKQTQAQFEKFLPQFQKSFEDMAVEGKANMDAFVKAGEIAQAGTKSLTDEMTKLQKTAMEQTVANAKALMGIKNVQEAIELESGYVRKSFDNWVADSNKVAELSMKIATDVAKPIQARATAAAETVNKTVAV